MPFDSTSLRTKFFYGRKDNMDLFGMQQVADRMGIFRFNDITSSRYPWYLWLYDPLSFRNTTGWYHIVWVQYQNWMRMYVYKPDGTMVCNSYYIEIPEEMKNLTDWGLGNDAGSGASQSLILDDFKVYNWPLSPDEVRALDSLERPSSLPMAKDCNSCYAIDYTTDRQISVRSSVSLYPNPASKHLTIEIDAIADEEVLITMAGMDGKIALSYTSKISEGNNKIELRNINVSPGNYLINISNSKTLNGSHKISIY